MSREESRSVPWRRSKVPYEYIVTRISSSKQLLVLLWLVLMGEYHGSLVTENVKPRFRTARGHLVTKD